MPIGKCPLRLHEGVLVRSHLLPQAAYDLCTDNGASPVRIGDGVVMHTDRQIQDYLLYADCEDILNKRGESWVNPKLATLQKNFPLHDLLMGAQAGFEDDEGGIYYAGTNPEFEVEKLTHFALGIFWKAAVHSWSGSKTEPMIDLGNYTEAIRTWLLGESEFPQNVCFTVGLGKPETAVIVLQQPVEIEWRPWRTFAFCVPGVSFELHVGENIDAEMQMCCFYHKPTHPVFVSNHVMRALGARIGKDSLESRKTHSYLRQRAKT